jgi:hypothetical protein
MNSEESSRSRRLLADLDVARWHGNLREGSELTADIYVRRLDFVCEQFGVSPRSLAGFDSKAACDFLLDMVQRYRSKGLAGSTIKGYIKPVRSWFQHSNISVNGTIKIKDADKTPTLVNEKIPESHELHSVWKFCRPRQEAEISLIAFAGVRPEAIGSYHGRDGLRLADLPELHYDDAQCKVAFDVVPTRVVVRDGLSKMGSAYESFLCREGCERLEMYLVGRMKEGEKLGPQSPVVAGYGSGSVVSTKTVCEDIKEVFKRAGFLWRPYILRRYFDARLDLAKARAEFGLPESWIVFWMGHEGDIEAVYRTKKKLSDSQLAMMRAAYQRAATILQTVETQSSQDTQQIEFRVLALRSVGYTNKDLAGLDFGALTTEQFQELVSKRLNGGAKKQLIVTPEEAERYVNILGGWHIKESDGVLPNGKVVIESAGGPRP